MTPRRFGPELTADGATFRLWAPAARTVEAVVADTRHDMKRSDDGWFATDVRGSLSDRRDTRVRCRLSRVSAGYTLENRSRKKCGPDV